MHTSWCVAFRIVKKMNEDGRVFLSAQKQPYVFQWLEKFGK